MFKACLGVLTALLLTPVGAHCQDARISVDASKVLNRVSPRLYGSCIEDVNHEIYGGLYDQKIFGESFEEPPQSAQFVGWSVLGGDWQPEGAGVAVGAQPGAKLVSTAPTFSNGQVEAEVRFPNGNGDNAGLLVRVSNAGVGANNFDGYEISLRPGAQSLLLGRHRHDWKPLVEVAATFIPTAWNRLRVELQGARIRVFLNGGAAPLIDFTDTDVPLLAGTFALRTWHSDAAFQNVRVQSGANAIQHPFRVQRPKVLVSGMWDSIRSGGAQAAFRQDAVNPYNGTLSQMIRHRVGEGTVGVANRGLNRWGIAVRRKQKLGGRLYLRGQNLQGPVTLALQSADGKRTYATQKIKKVGANWAKYPISLTSNAADAQARFIVILDRPGAVWVDQAVLTGTGADQFKGLPIRADIAKKMQEQGLTFLRYGGTMVNAPEYRWKNMIGDPDKRPPYRGHWYPYSTNGFGIEEFLKFCEAAGFEAAFAINVEETPQDAAAMVEYLNGAVTTPWGKRRAQNGRARPYNVRWIEIGNEEVIWADSATDYDHYIARFKVLYEAMHAEDPRIQFVNAAWWRGDSPNMERVFKALNGKAAFWDLHTWTDDPRTGAAIDRILTEMQALFQKWAPGTTMKCVIFEENGGLHNMQRALGHATTLNAVRRHGDFVPVSCPANALQPYQQNDNGWDQGQIFFTPSQVWGMPPFYAQQMAARNHLPLRVQSTLEGTQELDVTATRSEDGKSLVLHVVNTNENRLSAHLNIKGFNLIQTTVHVETLAAPLNAVNPVDKPTLIHPQRSEWKTKDGAAAYTFAPHSITILRWK